MENKDINTESKLIYVMKEIMILKQKDINNRAIRNLMNFQLYT
jgi:hypothetical protein